MILHIAFERIWDELSGLTPERWVTFEAHYALVPRGVYVYTNEAEELATALRRFAAVSGARGPA